MCHVACVPCGLQPRGCMAHPASAQARGAPQSAPMTSSSTMLRLISLAAFCSMASMRVCDPMLVALSLEYKITTGDASAVIAAFAVAYGVLQLVYGPLGAQHEANGRRHVQKDANQDGQHHAHDGY